jgi:hypothetical protein
VRDTGARYFVPDPAAPPVQPRAAPPTFSVLIPCYQAAHTVASAVTSVLGQTVAAHEVIVCDDGSTDDPAAALAPYLDRILLLRQPNGGVAAARNLGLRRAGGEFVAVCDADDEYLPELIEGLGALAMARSDLDILCCDGFIEEDGQNLGRGRPEPSTFVTDDQRLGILKTNFIPGRSAFRRELLLKAGGYDETLECAEDWDSWIRLILGGARAGLIDVPLARTRLRSGSLTSSLVSVQRGQSATLTKTLRREDLSSAERSAAQRHLALLRSSLLVVEAQEALESGSDGARIRCLRVALSRSCPIRTRLKAVGAFVAPRRAARHLRRNPAPDPRRLGYRVTRPGENG